MKSLIIGLTVAIIVLAGLIGFLIYASQENISQTVIKLTNPCLDAWNEINRSGKLTSGEAYRLTEREGELFYGVFGENNCRQNLDWLPEDHPDYTRLHQMWVKR